MAKKKERSLGMKIFTGVWKVIKFIFTPLFYVLSMLCLWLPVLYCIFGYALYLFMGFDPFALDDISVYYIIGLIISILVSGIMLVKRSFSHNKKHKKEKEKALNRDKEHAKKRSQKKANNNSSNTSRRSRKENSDSDYEGDEDEYEDEYEEQSAPARRKKHWGSGSQNNEVKDRSAAMQQRTKFQRTGKSNQRNDSNQRYDSNQRNDSNQRHDSYENSGYPNKNARNYTYGGGYQQPERRYVEEPDVYFSAREENTLVHEYSNRFEVFRIVDGERKLTEVLFKDGK